MKVWYNMCVKLAMAVCAIALAESAAAKPLAVGPLGPGEYADNAEELGIKSCPYVQQGLTMCRFRRVDFAGQLRRKG